MNGQLSDLIYECMKMKDQLNEVLSILIAMMPPWFIKQHFKAESPIPEEEQKELKEKGRNLGGWGEVSKKYDSMKKYFDEKVSILAEILEEEDFVIERFQTDLNEEQLSWLNSHIREIKQRLKGIEVI